MPNLLTDAQAGSEVPSLAVNAGLPTLLVLTGPCAPPSGASRLRVR